jgi:photosystem II stability/assembly factor-like uncharacterized protein
LYGRFDSASWKAKKNSILILSIAILLLATFPLPCVKAQSSSLFSDGFESGNFNAWTRTNTYLGTVSVSTAVAHNGIRSAKGVVSSNGGWAVVYKDISSTTTVYWQGYIYVSSQRIQSGSIAKFMELLNVWYPVARLGVQNSGGTLHWALSYGDGAGTEQFRTSTDTVSLGTWYNVQLAAYANGGAGWTQLWINGVAKLQALNVNTGSQINRIDVGAADAISTAYIDTVNATTGPAPNPTPTPSPSPTPTATPSPTPTPIPTPSPTPTVSPTPTPKATPTPTPTETPSPIPNATPNPSPSPTPTPSPTPPPVYKETNITKAIQSCWTANDGTLYAGSYQTLYKSINQGINWQPLITFNGSSTTLESVFVNKLNYVFASPDTTATASSSGLWRSINSGQTWSKVLPLSSACSILSMDEDSNSNLYAGIYTGVTSSGSVVGNASICKSVDGGAHWTTVYYNDSARHVHCVTVDKSNNYVYAALGDVRVNDVLWHAAVIRSTDGGGNWKQILSLPQMLSIEAVDITNSTGQLVPAARILSTDYDNGQIYRTTDDSNFNLVLDTGARSYGYWIRTNSLNGNIYASFAAGENPTSWVAGIWVSTNNGVTWSVYKSFSTHTAYCGSGSASNFFEGNLYYSVIMDSGWQIGTRIYPSYSMSSQTQNLLTAAFDLLPNIGILQWVTGNSGVMLLAAFTGIALIISNRKKTINLLVVAYKNHAD